MYNLELDKVIKRIKKEKAKLVCVQLPAGLKPKAAEIQKEIEDKSDSNVIIWAGSCFGACDIPVEIDKLGVDLLVHIGHSEYIKR